MKSIVKLSAKSVLRPLGLTALASTTDATTLIILKEEKNDIKKIVKSFEELGLLIVAVSRTTKSKTK